MTLLPGCRRVAAAALVAVLVLLIPATAAADHLAVDVSAPDTAALGETIEITTLVRMLETGEPVEGVEIVFYSDATFAGVSGEVELGRAVSDSAGVAVFPLSLAVSGTHAIRIEAIAGPEVQPESVSLPVTVGGQLVRSEAGVDIPGFGGWIVTMIIALIWAIMLLAVVRLTMVERAGPSGRRIGLSWGVLIASALLAVGITVLLVRSPDTHANLNPEGYDRTVVAFTEADYLFPGQGLADHITAEQSVAYGRALFTARGCAGCHGVNAEGAATAGSPAFASRDWLGRVVRTGLPGGMPAYTELDLDEEALDAIYVFLFATQASLEAEGVEPEAPQPVTTTTTTTVASETTTTVVAGEPAVPTFATLVSPILQQHCAECHGSLGGWNADTLDSVLTTGDHAPVVVLGDPDGSLLVQKIRGEQAEGLPMPPSGLMSDYEIQVIVDWIQAGAPG